MGTPIPITLIVASGPTVNLRSGLMVGPRALQCSVCLPHIAIVGGRAESIGGDEASSQLIPLSIRLLPSHKYIRGGEGTVGRYAFSQPSSLLLHHRLRLPSSSASTMTRHGAQASDTRVLDFGLSNVGDDGVGVAEKLVPVGTLLRRG